MDERSEEEKRAGLRRSARAGVYQVINVRKFGMALRKGDVDVLEWTDIATVIKATPETARPCEGGIVFFTELEIGLPFSEMEYVKEHGGKATQENVKAVFGYGAAHERMLRWYEARDKHKTIIQEIDVDGTE